MPQDGFFKTKYQVIAHISAPVGATTGRPATTKNITENITKNIAETASTTCGTLYARMPVLIVGRSRRPPTLKSSFI